MNLLPRELVSVIAEHADARTLARLRAASKTFKAAGNDAIRRTPARRRPTGGPSYLKGTGRHQRLYNRLFGEVFSTSLSMWRAMGYSGLEMHLLDDVEDPDPPPRIRNDARIRNALQCLGLTVFLARGRSAYDDGAAEGDDAEEEDSPPNSLNRYFWNYFSRYIGMRDIAGFVPSARAGLETHMDRVLEYAKYKLDKIRRNEKRRKLRSKPEVDGHVPLYRLMRGLAI